MRYQSPIHLVSDKDLDSINIESLKRLKKEVLLRFSISNETSISINGKEYDKQTVNEIFEELKNDLEFHLTIFKNKPLLDFIEKGDLSFFRDKKAQNEILYGHSNSKVYSLFAEKYAHIVYQAISNTNQETLRSLKVLKDSGIAIRAEEEIMIFTKSFEALSGFVNRFNAACDPSYQTSEHRKLRPEIKEYVNINTRYLLSLLPAAFDTLKESFAHVIRRRLLNDTFGANFPKIIQTEKESVQTLLLAAFIDKDILNKEDIDNIISILEKLLDSEPDKYKNARPSAASTSQSQQKTQRTQSQPKQKPTPRPTSSSSDGSTGKAIGFTLLLVLFLFRLAINAERCGRNNTYTNNNRTYNNSSYQKRSNSNYNYKPKKPKTFGYQSKPNKSSVEKETSDNSSASPKSEIREAYKQTESVDVDRLKFNPQDLFGRWEIVRTVWTEGEGEETEEASGEITYSYAFLNYSEGTRTISYSSDPDLPDYSVVQSFNYSASPENYYSGKLNLILNKTEYKGCDGTAGQGLLRLAEKQKELEEGFYSKNTSIDFSIPANKSFGIALGQETFGLALGDGDVSLYKTEKARKNYIVNYVNKIMETRGSSLGPSNRPLRFYADRKGENLIVKSAQHLDTLAQIKVSNKDKIYFIPNEKVTGEGTFSCYKVDKIYYQNKKRRYRYGEMVINFHRKEGFSVEMK